MSRFALVVLALAASSGCQRTPPPPPPPPAVEPPAHPAAQPAAQPVAQAEASGPRAEFTTASYRLAAVIAPGADAAAPASLTVELHGEGHFHVNDQYPVALELDVRDGSTPKASLRRADAAEFTQRALRYVAAIQRAGARTVVHGRLRFAVCSAENCVPESQNFAVAVE